MTGRPSQLQIDNRIIKTTFFSDRSSRDKSEEDLTLPALKKKILTTRAAEKALLPWLKLAVFGDVPTAKGSLRHDGNVKAITGVELDYDGERVSFGQAVGTLSDEGLLCLVYTTPSHTTERPRWRVLLPTSTELPPAIREKLVARVNGLFDGVFASESFTLSQSYFFGQAAGKPAVQAEVVEGEYIDRREDLDSTAIGKRGGDRRSKARGFDEQAAIESIASGEEYHESTTGLLGKMARNGVPVKEAAGRLREIYERVGEPRRDKRWRSRYDDIERCAEGIYSKEDTKIDAGIERVLAEFNARYMVVNESGRAVVYEHRFDQALNRLHFEAMQFEDLRRLYLNRRIEVGTRGNGKSIYKTVAECWLEHARRRQYLGGLIFDPSRKHEAADKLNLWQGFAVESKGGDWSLLKDHMLKVICSGNQEHYDYLLGWMARCVQLPAQRGEVATVMRGGEGCGKGILANALLHIFGQHGLLISNSRHLTGNFNGHLQDTVFLFADEAFFAGDKAHTGVLKSLITEQVVTLEAKFKNAAQRPNYVHLMMASNEVWVVPSSLDSRRFFVLDVASDRIGDFAYFEKIMKQLDNGGYEAMLHELMHHDISSFNVRRVPTTSGLNQQRMQSLKTEDSWWLEVLQRGYVHRSKLGVESYFSEWHDVVSTEVLFKSYEEFASSKRERRPLGREQFGKLMARMGNHQCKIRNAVIGEHLAESEDGGRAARPVIQDRANGYRLGMLASARTQFAQVTGLTVEWPNDGPNVPLYEPETPRLSAVGSWGDGEPM